MILGMTIRWQCDRCGYKKTAHYSEDRVNNPKIRCLPHGWSRYGKKRKRGDQKVECGECPYDLRKMDKKAKRKAS